MSDWYDERTNAYIEWCFGQIDDVCHDLGQAAGLTTGTRVLDIGCNTGTSSRYFAQKFNCSVVGVDAAKPAIEVAEKRRRGEFPELNVSFKVMDARDTVFDSESFDAIVSKDTFVNIEDRPRLLAEIARLLKPGGQLAFCDWMQGNDQPTQAFLDWREFKKEEPFEMLSLDGYEAQLIDLGFAEISSRDRAQEFQERIRARYKNFVRADPEEMQRRFGIEDHGYFVKRFGLTLDVLLAGDVVWGHISARKL